MYPVMTFWHSVATGAIVLLAACTPEAPAPTIDEPANELKWAQAALERNPELKVVAVDKEHHSIRVAIKSTGELVNVTPGELAAIPIADLVALTRKPSHTEPAPTPVEETLTVAPAPPEAPPERVATGYKIEHQAGRMRITGPGVNVESTGVAESVTPPSAPPRVDEPLICEGPRLLHLDRRRLNVDGDAIIARGGCELHITNSEIIATGTGIVVQDATVHINNSSVRGETASVDAARPAKMFLANTRFVGVVRRDAHAHIADRGGNTWR